MSIQPTSFANSPPSSPATNSAPKPTRRACDCCRKRKVRCDNEDPCGPCKKASIRCAYLQAAKKKGPKGLRSVRVLHALRKIDEAIPYQSKASSPLSPSAFASNFQQWAWASGESSPSSGSGPPSATYHEPPTSYPDSVPPDAPAPDPSCFSTGLPPTTQLFPPSVQLPGAASTAQDVPSPQTESSGSYTNYQHNGIPITEPAYTRLPGDFFFPYVRLFFSHMYPIMPIIDRRVYLDPGMYSSMTCLTSETYTFLCALSATTIVQLDAAAQLPPFSVPPGIPPTDGPAELFANECLRARKTYDYIEHPTTLSVMTSFFLFCYYGNKEKAEKAWYYLQESISFAQTLDLDDEHAILKLDPIEAQWRRRLYWLLFITER